MLTIPRKKVAVVPIFDSEETRGGIIKPSSFVYKRDKQVFEIIDFMTGKKMDETDDMEIANKMLNKYRRQGIKPTVRRRQEQIEEQPLPAGERCDQGIVKYVGLDVVDVKIGDYVFFSGYTGTLVNIEGEGKLIILPADFVECTFDLDKFTEIPGLYFKSKDGTYFKATYEQVMNVIAETFTFLNKTVEIKSSKPKYEDYNTR